jgi:hypothetical protein
MSSQVVYGLVNKAGNCPVFVRPSLMAPVGVYLRRGDLVEIDDDNSTACYYKVIAETGDEGYILINNIDRKE